MGATHSNIAVTADYGCRPPWTTNSSIGMAVNTTSGLITGHASPVYPYVSEYLGIPFAKAPLADLRFMPPQPFDGQDNHFTADKLPPSCPQPSSIVNTTESIPFQGYSEAAASYANHTSEDCLYLNVWTKFPSIGSKAKPVLVWIYGGGYHSGGANDDSQHGAIFAEEQDVVMVNLNYRLSILGFSGAPGVEQNVALLDQRLAIEWTRNNIAAFGGNPESITIMGHSAGGSSVDYYNFAWTQDPIIAGSVIMSGNVFSFGSHTPETASKAWNTAASLLGCGNTTSSSDTAVLKCMQTRNVTDLVKVAPAVEKSLDGMLSPASRAYLGVTGPFGPTIDNKTIFNNYTDRAKAREFIQKPVLTGVNDGEGCFFAENGQIPASGIDQLTTQVFTCPTYLESQARVETDVPVWQYRFFGAYPNTYANACPGRGWHGQEVYVMFNSTEQDTNINTTANEDNDGHYLRQMIGTFVHNPHHGLSKYMGLPTVEDSAGNVIVLGLNGTVETLQNASIWENVCKTTLGIESLRYFDQC